MPLTQAPNHWLQLQELRILGARLGRPALTHLSGVWIWWLGDIRPDHREALSTSGCRPIYLKVFDDLHAESMFWKRQCTPELIASMKAAALFGHPGLHRGVPWALLDDKTGLAFP